MRILQENSICLIIDVQERLFPYVNNHEILEKNISTLISGVNVLGIPVLLTEQYSKGLGPTISSIISLIEPNNSIEKNAFSCCDEPAFITSLQNSGKKNIIIAGIESHICVLQTALDLLENGFQPVVVEDCVSSRNVNDKNIAILRMKEEGVIITTYESILFELVRISGTERFKAISKLLK